MTVRVLRRHVVVGGVLVVMRVHSVVHVTLVHVVGRWVVTLVVGVLVGVVMHAAVGVVSHVGVVMGLMRDHMVSFGVVHWLVVHYSGHFVVDHWAGMVSVVMSLSMVHRGAVMAVVMDLGVVDWGSNMMGIVVSFSVMNWSGVVNISVVCGCSVVRSNVVIAAVGVCLLQSSVVRCSLVVNDWGCVVHNWLLHEHLSVVHGRSMVSLSVVGHLGVVSGGTMVLSSDVVRLVMMSDSLVMGLLNVVRVLDMVHRGVSVVLSVAHMGVLGVVSHRARWHVVLLVVRHVSRCVVHWFRVVALMVHSGVVIAAVGVCLLQRSVVNDWGRVVHRGSMVRNWLLNQNFGVVHWGGMVRVMMDRGRVVAFVVHDGSMMALMVHWSCMMDDRGLVVRFSVMDWSVMMDLSVVNDRCCVMHNSLVMRIMVDGLGVVNNSLVMHYWGLVVDHWGVVDWRGMVALMVHWGNSVMTLVMDRSAVMNLGVVDWRDSVVRLSMVHNRLLEKNLSMVHVVLIVVMGRSTVHMGRLKRSLVSLEVGLLVNGGLSVMQNWSFNWGLVVHWFRVVALMVYWLRVVNDSLVMHRLRVVAFVMKHWLDSWFLEDSLVMSVMRFLVMAIVVDRLGVVHNSFMMHYWL